MPTDTWDPQQYARFAPHRDRPFSELIARVPDIAPSRVVDLGCGPGHGVLWLQRRWPGAEVLGLDSSQAMVSAARKAGATAEVADVVDWAVTGGDPVDLLVSTALLQWVPGHLDLLPALVRRVRPGGVFAMSVPGNFGEPSHTLRRQLAARPRYAEHLTGVADPASHEPAAFLKVLAAVGCEVDAWETTYLHVLDPRGEDRDPVFTWVSATGARPTLEALPADVQGRFADELKKLLRQAYPRTDVGVVLPFRRVFAVARVFGGPGGHG